MVNRTKLRANNLLLNILKINKREFTATYMYDTSLRPKKKTVAMRINIKRMIIGVQYFTKTARNVLGQLEKPFRNCFLFKKTRVLMAMHSFLFYEQVFENCFL